MEILTEEQLKYRREHKKCSYCDHCIVTKSIVNRKKIMECTIKDKDIQFDRLNARFCKYYKVQ